MTEAISLYPVDTIRNWKSYADHVVTYTVLDDRELPPSAATQESGEGYIGREATIRIERVLWSAPSAPDLPGQFDMNVPGWVAKNGGIRQLDFHDAPRILVGSQYLAPMVLESESKNPWSPLAPSVQAPVQDGRVVRGDVLGEGSSLFKSLEGRMVSDIATEIESAEPEPLAWKYRALRPAERVEAVAAERGG